MLCVLYFLTAVRAMRPAPVIHDPLNGGGPVVITRRSGRRRPIVDALQQLRPASEVPARGAGLAQEVPASKLMAVSSKAGGTFSSRKSELASLLELDGSVSPTENASQGVSEKDKPASQTENAFPGGSEQVQPVDVSRHVDTVKTPTAQLSPPVEVQLVEVPAASADAVQTPTAQQSPPVEATGTNTQAPLFVDSAAPEGLSHPKTLADLLNESRKEQLKLVAKQHEEQGAQILHGQDIEYNQEGVKGLVMFFYILVPSVQTFVMLVLICFGEWKRSVGGKSGGKKGKSPSLEDGIESDSGSEAGLALEDEEDLGNYSSTVDKSIVFGNMNFSMRFSCSEIEAAFSRDQVRRGLVLGARALTIAAGLVFANVLRNSMKDTSCGYISMNAAYPHLGMLGVAFLFTAFLSWQPSGSLYMVALAYWFVYMIARAMPPFRFSCQQLQELPVCLVDDTNFRRIQEHDCSLLGHTEQQGIVTFILMLPWALPSLQSMHLVWLWIFLVYGISLVCEQVVTEDYSPGQICFSLALLSLALTIATVKKHEMELHQRLSFISDLREKQTSMRMFQIFEFMVPVHMIGRMINKPGEPIADSVPRVAILFVIIVDFERFAHKMTPRQLLKFLNEQFSKMDRICAKNEVTKVETVSEEYVACVGAVPADIETADRDGFTLVNARLFRAAKAILQQQTAEVTFQMGIHSGPVVAGVIGHKLPRYRLFGDTINTAARMMQKGVAGRMQFGEETHKDLTDEFEVEYRGEVEMKGKGQVKAWLLKNPQAPAAKASVHLGVPGAKGNMMTVMRSMRAEAPAADSHDDEADNNKEGGSREFEAVLAEMETSAAGDSSKTGGSMLSMQEDLSPEVEEAWDRWFHKMHVHRNILVRLDRLAFLLSLLTLCETVYIMETKAWMVNSSIFPGWLRVPVFEAARTSAFIIIIGWRAGLQSNSYQTKTGVFVQIGVIASLCFICCLLFVSYDVMTTTDDTQHIVNHRTYHLGPNSDGKASVEMMRMDQMFSLLFVLVFFVMTTSETTRFSVSLAFPLFAYLIMFGTFTTIFGKLFFHNEGRLLFVATAFLTSWVAWEGEKAMRARFKAKWAVQQMERRVETILSTLMPPLLMEQLRALPVDAALPSHQYRAATVCQSDLCGFTQLAATVQPREVVAFMSDLFGRFDVLCDSFGIYKVETIGDAYIAGMAEHTLTRKNSPIAVINFSLAMIEAVHAWAKPMGVKMTCRVGVHTGECIGGIIGTGMQRYHLFGKLISIIEVLESTAPEAQVQVSPACKGMAEHDLGPNGDQEPGGGLVFTVREESSLKTSKGHVHEYDEVGGRTFIVSNPYD